jgi:hypothetical protein
LSDSDKKELLKAKLYGMMYNEKEFSKLPQETQDKIINWIMGEVDNTKHIILKFTNPLFRMKLKKAIGDILKEDGIIETKTA